MLIVIAGIVIVWLSISALVWAACFVAARGDVAELAPDARARAWRRPASEASERLTISIWESLPGLPVPDPTLGAQGAR